MGQRMSGGILTEESGSDDSDDDIDRNEIFDLLSNHRRRYVIHYCMSTDEEAVELSDLAEQITAWEQDKDVTEITSGERKTVYTSLQQTHLPRLERAGMITFESGTVELTDEVRRLGIYLDIVPENTIPWGAYYLGLSLLAGLIVGALWIGLLPANPVSPLIYLTGTVLVFGVSAAYHAYTTRKYRFDEFEQPP